MDFDFTKADIQNIEFTCRRNKFYYASEVDEYLSRLADSAEQQAAELDRLRAVEAEYDRRRQEIGEALLNARRAAQEQAQRERAQFMAETEQLTSQRAALLREISALQQQKSAAMDQFRRALSSLLSQVEKEQIKDGS